MAKTFKDLNGNVVIIERDTRFDTDEDIVTNEVSRYIIEVEGIQYEVDRITYEKVKEHIEG